MRILGCIAALAVAWPAASVAAPLFDVINPNKADWEFQPSVEMMSAAYPPLALALGVEASTTMQCGVDRLGVLHDCIIVELKGPKGLGFEAASLKLAPIFRLRPERMPSGKSRNSTARFPLSFRMPPLKSDFPTLEPAPPADLIPLARQQVARFVIGDQLDGVFRQTNENLATAETPGVDDATRTEVMADIRASQAKARADVMEFDAQLLAANLTRGQIQAAVDFEKTSGAEVIHRARDSIRRQVEKSADEKRFWLLYASHREFCGAHDCKAAPGSDVAPLSPPWIQQPSPAQIEAVWPKLAVLLLVGGYADLDCASTEFGVLTNCQVAREHPDSLGFGAAALAVASYYQRPPPTVRGERTSLRVAFPFPDAAGLEPPVVQRKQGPKYVLARQVVEAEGQPAFLGSQARRMLEIIDQIELPGVPDATRTEGLAVLRKHLQAAIDDTVAETAERYADLLTEAELKERLAYVESPDYASLTVMNEKMTKTYAQLNEVIYGRITREAGRLYCAKHDCPPLPPYRGPRTAADPVPPFRP